jgi:hypothetical protein
MKKLRLNRVLYTCYNTCLLLISLGLIIYSISSLFIAEIGAKTIFNTVNKDYEACFGKEYIHEESYFTDITCMKLEIASNIIITSSNLKNQYFDNIKHEISDNVTYSTKDLNIHESESYATLVDSLSNIQDYNNSIQHKESSLLLLNNYNLLYSSLNYITYGNDALLIDHANFITDQEALSLAADKDIQEIRVMSNMSTDIVLNLNKLIYFYRFTILVCIIFLLGTCLNIYRIKVRKNKYNKKRRLILK